MINKFGDLQKDYFIVVFHPETVTNTTVELQMKELLNAIDTFKKQYDFIFIGSNSDTGSNIIFNLLDNYTKENNFRFLTSVKPEEYLSLIKYSKGLIGNSSSGIIEVPSLKIPTINIGDRQKGRVRGNTVIDVLIDKNEIIQAIKKSQTNMFNQILEKNINPYYKDSVMENAYQIIIKFLNSNKMNEVKDFYDF